MSSWCNNNHRYLLLIILCQGERGNKIRFGGKKPHTDKMTKIYSTENLIRFFLKFTLFQHDLRGSDSRCTEVHIAYQNNKILHIIQWI